MRHRVLLLLCLGALAVWPASVSVQEPGKGPYTFPPGYETPWEKIQIAVTQKMSPNLFVLHGSEGLDPAHPEASGGRVMALFGALIFSQGNLRAEMLRPPRRANGQPAPAPDMAGIPVATYDYNAAAPGRPAVTFAMNGETVDFIPMMPSHTAGDTIVFFRKADVIYIEDFYRNFGYPYADQANGGSIKGMLDAIDLIEKLAGPNTTLVPGHGTLVKKPDLLPYRAMLVDIMAKVKTLRDQGKSLNEVLAANLTAPYDKTTQGDTQQSKDRFITEAYDEVKDFPPVVDGKRTMPARP
jgi:cyclase